MCERCSEIRLVSLFRSPREYLQTVEYIKQLIASGDFSLVSGNCPLDEVKDKDGQWADDIIYHLIRCETCGQEFSCCVNTYRGGGGFAKGK